MKRIYHFLAFIFLTVALTFSSVSNKTTAAPMQTQDTTYLWIPNAFTPDGDGYNEVFKVITNKKVWGFNMTILNIWGERLYTTENIEEGWDGKYKEEPMHAGVYVYVVKYRETIDNLPVTKTGALHLIR